jgi:hypothetical protein
MMVKEDNLDKDILAGHAISDDAKAFINACWAMYVTTLLYHLQTHPSFLSPHLDASITAWRSTSVCAATLT